MLVYIIAGYLVGALGTFFAFRRFDTNLQVDDRRPANVWYAAGAWPVAWFTLGVLLLVLLARLSRVRKRVKTAMEALNRNGEGP